MRLIAAFLALALLAGCAAAPVEESANQPYFAPGKLLTLPKPGHIGRNIEVAQLITVRHDKDVFSFEGHVSVTPDRFYLVGVDGIGRRAMTITWEKSGKVVAERADWLPEAVRPGAMLADIVLLYWPKDALVSALAATGATLEETAHHREIRIDGKTVMSIDYLGGAPGSWSGNLRYRNDAWGYEIDVQSVEATP